MSDESIISGICFSSIFSSHFFHLSFTRAGSATVSISLSSKRPLSKLVNGWFKNCFVNSLNCFLPLSMIAKKCLHKSLVLLKSRHEQLKNVSLSPQEALYFNFVSFIPGSSEQTSKDPSVYSLKESIIRVDTLWALSNTNVTNDRGLCCKYERIFSAYVLYPDENLTLSNTYFLYNFGRNLEIMISRSSLREQFLNPTNSSCSRSPLILSVPLLVLQDIRSFRRKKRHQRCVSGYHVPTFKKTNYSKNTVLIIKDFKKSKHLAK